MYMEVQLLKMHNKENEQKNDKNKENNYSENGFMSLPAIHVCMYKWHIS
jgi:hypothetical protein